ncbi:MAG: hypothetical protein ACXW3G_10410 [Rhodoplanes sp.]
MSISEQTPGATDFERWLPSAFAEMGAFTALVVLVDIEGTRVTPLCSTYFNVIGDKVVWDDIVLMFAGSGAAWDGAAFSRRRERRAGRSTIRPRGCGCARSRRGSRRIGWCSTKAASSIAADDD